MSTAVEQRLAAALEARAELVGPEHLTPCPLPDPALPEPARLDPGDPGDAGEPGPGAWRRRATYAAVAAAAVAVLAVPVWLADGPVERRPAPADVPAPDGWVGGTGRTGPGAGLPAIRVSADLDADGAPDTVWLRAVEATGSSGPGPVRVEALLSSAPEEVRWTVLRERAYLAQVESPGGRDAGVQLDDEAGGELVVYLQPSPTGDAVLAAVDLVGGRLVEADVDPGAPLGAGAGPDGRGLGFGFVDGALVTTRALVPATTAEVRYERSEAWTWALVPRAAGQRPLLTWTASGQLCRDLYGYGPAACVPGTDRPVETAPPVGEGENPSDVVPDFYPEATSQLAPGEVLAFETDSGSGTAALTGPETDPRLEVELDGTAYAVGLGGGDPARLLGGTVAGAAAPGFAVLRESGDATAWSVWTVRGGALVEVEALADEVPLGSGFRETADGLQAYSTHLSVSGLLTTRLRAAVGGDPEVAEVWTWSLDEGPALLATGAPCFRFPADGSAPTFATRC